MNDAVNGMIVVYQRAAEEPSRTRYAVMHGPRNSRILEPYLSTDVRPSHRGCRQFEDLLDDKQWEPCSDRPGKAQLVPRKPRHQR